jgi:hypothetical protein
MDGWPNRCEASFHPSSHQCKALACVPSLPIAFSIVSRLYFTLSSPCQSKQTMMGRMDDWTDGRMSDGTNGWNDASRHPLLYFLLLSPPRCVCIPLFLRRIGLNRPWWDRWMDEWMDEGTDGWNDASRRPLLYVIHWKKKNPVNKIKDEIHPSKYKAIENASRHNSKKK